MAFNLARAIARGYKFESHQNGVSVLAPNGQSGHGSDAEQAMANVGAQIIPVVRDDYVGRLLIRQDGSEVMLDKAGIR